MGWLASKEYIPSIIAGATRPDQPEQNVKAAAWRLNEDQKKALKELLPTA
jgi:aryl-alcohol dehydrogenase-like predicted oxidoreductase